MGGGDSDAAICDLGRLYLLAGKELKRGRAAADAGRAALANPIRCSFHMDICRLGPGGGPGSLVAAILFDGAGHALVEPTGVDYAIAGISPGAAGAAIAEMIVSYGEPAQYYIIVITATVSPICDILLACD